MEYFKEELYYDDARMHRDHQYEASLESIEKNQLLMGKRSTEIVRKSRTVD